MTDRRAKRTTAVDVAAIGAVLFGLVTFVWTICWVIS